MRLGWPWPWLGLVVVLRVVIVLLTLGMSTAWGACMGGAVCICGVLFLDQFICLSIVYAWQVVACYLNRCAVSLAI